MSNLPPLPPGFVLEDDPQQAAMPAPPPGFEMMPPEDPHLSNLSPGGRAAVKAGRSRYTGDVNGTGGSTFLGALDGMSFGFADEIGAGINSTIDAGLGAITGREGKSYDQWLAKMRGLQENAQENHPYVYTAGQIGGGLATAGGVLKAAPTTGAKLLGVGGRNIGERAVMATASGAGMGAVQGFGSGEGGFEERAKSAGVGAFAGGTVGLAAYPVGAAIGKGVNAAADLIASRGDPIGRGAQNVLRDTLANEGLTLEDAQRIAQQYGPTSMLADATEGLRYRTEQLVQADTPARSDVIGALRERSRTAGQRITGAYDEALGPRPNVKTELDRLTGERRTRANALYGQARAENAPVDVSPVIAAIDDQLLTPAERIAGASDLPDDATDAALRWARSHLTNGTEQRAGIDKLDKLERRIRGRTRTAFANGDSDVGSALANVGRVLRDQMKASSPVYRQARETFADDASVLEAFETGQALFGRKVHPDFLGSEIADMSEAERQALRLGTRAAVDQAMGSVRNGSLKGRQLLDADWNERKILTVLGEDDGRKLIDTLQSESAMADTASQVLGGPATARRLDNPFRKDAPTVERVPSGLVNAGLAVAQKGVDVATASSRRKLAGDLGPVLTATGETREQMILRLLETDAQRTARAANDRKNQAVAEALLRGGAVAGAPSARP